MADAHWLGARSVFYDSVAHAAWSVTANGFVPLSKTVNVHDNRLLRRVFGQGTLVSERDLAGIDGIVERRLRHGRQRASVQWFGYHYSMPAPASGTSQLLTTGAEMRVHTPLGLLARASRVETSLHYNKKRKWLLSLGLRLQSKNTPLHHMIEKTDVDVTPVYRRCDVSSGISCNDPLEMVGAPGCSSRTGSGSSNQTEHNTSTGDSGQRVTPLTKTSTKKKQQARVIQ